jgi:hypothetical protein
MDEDESSDLCPLCLGELEFIPWLGDLMCPNCNQTIDLEEFDD